jgi:hypothetical protein
MQQQLAWTGRIVVVAVAEGVLGDVGLHEPGLAVVVDLHPRLDE